MAMTTNKTVTGENIYYADAGLVVHVSFTEKISLQAITGDYDIKLSLTDCEVYRGGQCFLAESSQGKNQAGQEGGPGNGGLGAQSAAEE